MDTNRTDVTEEILITGNRKATLAVLHGHVNCAWSWIYFHKNLEKTNNSGNHHKKLEGILGELGQLGKRLA